MQPHKPGICQRKLVLRNGVDKALDADGLGKGRNIHLRKGLPILTVIGGVDANLHGDGDAGGFFPEEVHLDLLEGLLFFQIHNQIESVVDLIVEAYPLGSLTGQGLAENSVGKLTALVAVGICRSPSGGVALSGSQIYAAARVGKIGNRGSFRLGFRGNRVGGMGDDVDLVNAGIADAAAGDGLGNNVEFKAQGGCSDRGILGAAPLVTVPHGFGQLVVVKSGQLVEFGAVGRVGNHQILHRLGPTVDDGSDTGLVDREAAAQIHMEYHMVIGAVGSGLHIHPAAVIDAVAAVDTVYQACFRAVVDDMA